MKKVTFIILLIAFKVFAQDKPTIAMLSFKASNPEEDYIEAELAFQKVKTLLVQTNRFTIVDRESLGIIDIEQGIQSELTSINAEVVRQGRILGAEYIINGRLVSVEYKVIAGELYRPIFTLILEVLDVETSEVINSEEFKTGILDPNPGGVTKSEAFSSALKAKEKKILKNFINKFLPEKVSIVTIEENKGKTEALINTGSDSGTKKNYRFVVYKVSEIVVDGDKIKREQQISQLKVVEVQGTKLSLARVVKGEDELKEAFNNGDKLICKLK
ncbi:CsgG/HfaB family protein [Winogradskyella sp.]|uniref:CsgG/HfaB family protein n=1 Tax=Winogradskyella sp. TaxID=1883156 RepID=UPI003BA9472B